MSAKKQRDIGRVHVERALAELNKADPQTHDLEHVRMEIENALIWLRDPKDRRISIENVNALDPASFEREAARRSRLHALGRQR